MYDAMRIFKTEAEAKAFAQEIGSKSWGFLFEEKNDTIKITGWYVDYNEEV